MAKISPISGFPEWLPQQKIVEDKVVSIVREIYSLHGFTPIETRSVEPMSILSSKGEINKEIYVIKRAQDDNSPTDDSTLALHFDLTIPFARYVSQNFSELDFPFKRYQLQRSWRGERPQEGRFREFYQFDIDVVNPDDLPLCHDSEMIAIIHEAFNALKLGEYTIKINNRKILLGIYEHFGLTPEQRAEAVIIVDKILKIGAPAVVTELVAKGIDKASADEIVKISQVRLTVDEFSTASLKLGPTNDTYKMGVEEMNKILELLPESAKSCVSIDLSLARGLDYYTGLIIETILKEYPSFGSVAGGGRYDNLTARFGNKKIPGVGISIGITRLMSLILSKGLIEAKEKVPTKLLLSLNSDADLKQVTALATKLRANGIRTEVYHKPQKLGKQIEYADKKGIKYILFFVGGDLLELKNLATREQAAVTFEELVATLR